MDVRPPPLVHVLSPRAVPSPDADGRHDPYAPLGWVQWTTLASARAAREEYDRRLSSDAAGRRQSFGAVRLVCVVSASDHAALLPALSPYCHRVSAYHRSAATEFASLDRELPFVQDIFDAGIDYARDLTGDDGGPGRGDGYYYLMMTNADICLTSTYFVELEAIIADRPGAKAVTVNRKTVEDYEVPEPMGDTPEARHEAASELARHGGAMVASGRWTKHGGVDCFVLHSSIAEGLDLGRLFVGYPPWDWTLREVVETLDGSGRHRLVSRATSGGTYHFGNEAAWVPPFDNIKSPPAAELAFWSGFRGDELALVPWCIIVGFPPGDPYTLRNTVECGRVFLHKEWGGNGAPRIASSDGAEAAWVEGAELPMSPLGMRESPPGTGPRMSHKMNWLRKYAPGVDAEWRSVVDVAPPADGGLQRVLFGDGGGMPPVGTAGDLACVLPPCEIVRRSSLYSPRCAAGGGGGGDGGEGTDPRVSPLLVETTSSSVPAGLERFASDLADGAATGGTARYATVLHQVEDPLTGVAALCRQSVLTDQREAWRKRVPYGSSRLDAPDKATSCLELWVEWHQFLTVMRYPAYRIEDADAGGVADVAGLSGPGRSSRPGGGDSPGAAPSGGWEMRTSFTWRDLYTIDPVNALKAWDLAHYHGYEYPGVDFNRLTCLGRAPACRAGKSSGANPSCPAGTSPVLRPGGGDGGARLPGRPRPDGLAGWSDRGCVERPVAVPGVGGGEAAGTGRAGVRGVVSESELGALAPSPGAPSDPALLGLLAATAVGGTGGARRPPARRGAPVSVPSGTAAAVVCAVLLGAAAAVRSRPGRVGALISKFLGARGTRREN